MVNITFLYSSYVQTTENNMLAANQPITSNMSISQGNSPVFNVELILDTSALPYSNN